ncbi:hypothetical protein ZOSMA_34G00540 [Zostera marina]|uniref:Uncharacterized protein n=1 Tax=Zostera marina TaxID=29655 RepID=A0A0K9P6X4_ZOSMR|nr:hypothetical protein ZOSMA_34G00540 [Zostera marina]
MAWSRVTSSSRHRHHQSGLHPSQFDMYREFEDMDFGDDDFSQAEYSCPFCADDFDAVGLCCHIDEDHPVEVKNGVCPICSSRIGTGTDFAAHITLQHGSFFRIPRKRKPGRGSLGSYSAFSLKKEPKEPHIHALFGGSTYTAAGLPPSSSIPDPLLSSFIYNPPPMDLAKDVVKPEKLDDDDNLSGQNIDKQMVESSRPSLSDKDKKEKAQRSEFFQELLWSTIFPGNL